MAAKRTASQRGLGSAGRRLFDAVTSTYELDEHERSLLMQAARTADLLEDLQKLMDDDGLLNRRGFEDLRLSRIPAELARQRAVYMRLLSALKLPAGVELEGFWDVSQKRLRAVKGIGGPA